MCTSTLDLGAAEDNDGVIDLAVGHVRPNL
jgi:hypothetical protein